MKTFICTVLTLVALVFPSRAEEKEVTLFDSDGVPVAYVALDDEMNIYLWKGQPVAYLKKEGGETHIYGFNGDHLGWYDKGILRNHKGRVVGFVEGAVAKTTKMEPIKGIRRITPIKAIEKIAPPKPTPKDEFSDCPLKAFLFMGSKDY